MGSLIHSSAPKGARTYQCEAHSATTGLRKLGSLLRPHFLAPAALLVLSQALLQASSPTAGALGPKRMAGWLGHTQPLGRVGASQQQAQSARRRLSSASFTGSPAKHAASAASLAAACREPHGCRSALGCALGKAKLHLQRAARQQQIGRAHV